jgi:hypothetical protein
MAQEYARYRDRRLVTAVASILIVAAFVSVLTGVWLAGILVAAIGLSGVARRLRTAGR